MSCMYYYLYSSGNCSLYVKIQACGNERSAVPLLCIQESHAIINMKH